MDISDTLAPNSDQLDAVDLLGGPRTFTISDVKRGKTEQPVEIHLAEFPRVWRPGKSMRRVLAACWGTDASVYVGRRVTLYCDESVTFGPDVVGGTRISHLSHIDKARRIPLMVKRGKSATFTVKPLTDTPEPPRRAAPQRQSELPGHEGVIADVAAEQQALDGDVMTREQSQRLKAGFDAAGLTDPAVRLNYASDVVGRTLATSAELSQAEASDVIDALEKEGKP